MRGSRCRRADEIVAVQRAARDAGVPIAVLGIGTNVLVSDRGVRGIVIKLGRAFGRSSGGATDDRVDVRAGAAAPFKKLVMRGGRARPRPASSSPRAFPARSAAGC